MKRASEHPFPYGWQGKVCYFTLDAGHLEQVKTRVSMRFAVLAALADEVALYATWPGEYRTDLFVIDKPELLAAAIGLDVGAVA